LSPLPISDDERERRRYAIDFGRGSVRYEGGILSPEVESLNARFIDGKISLEELIASIRTICGVETAEQLRASTSKAQTDRL
jgi:hypothetical protein